MGLRSEQTQSDIKAREIVQVMGEGLSGDGDKTISNLNTISKELDKDFEKAWKNSFPKGNNSVVEEWAFSIVQDKKSSKYKAINMDTEHADGYSRPDYSINKTQKLIGSAHTHPYNKTDGAPYNAAFSSGDINHLGTHVKLGFTMFVEAGDRRFAMVIIDEKKAQSFFSTYDSDDIKSLYQNALDFSRSGGKSFSQSCSDAVRAVIGNDNGVGFYRTDDAQKHNFIRTNK